jgi:hypothetical protein
VAKFRAIRTRKLKLPQRVLPEAQAILTSFQRRGVREASRYPRQLPAKPRVNKKTGETTERKLYKRTNSLARSWSRESGVSGQGNKLIATVVSSPATAPYNILVVGPVKGAKGKRQTKEMRRRNWVSAPTLLDELWDTTYEPRLRKLLTNKA